MVLRPQACPFLRSSSLQTDRLPIRREDQPRARVGDFHPISARFVNIEEKRLLDGVLVRAGLDIDSRFEKDIGGAQDILAAIDRVGQMMKTALRAGVVGGVGEIVALVGARHPHGGFAAVVEHDLLGKTEAEVLFEENPVGLDVGGQAVQMVQPPDIDAAGGISLRLILQRRTKFGRRLIPLGLVIQFDLMAVRILAEERRAVPEVAVGPADIEARSLSARRRGVPAPAGCAREKPTWPIPEVFDAVSFSVWRS